MPRHCCFVALLATIACGPSHKGSGGDPAIDSGTPSVPDAATPVPVDAAAEGYQDFPADPIIDLGVPANAPDLFDTTGTTGGGPCLIEPEPGTLFPRNWLRARFRFVPPAGHNLFEIRLSAPSQQHDLVVYTLDEAWTIPASVWRQLNVNSLDEAIAVTVRSARYNGLDLDAPPAAGAAGEFTIAPVGASGSIVYWTSGASGAVAALKGFEVGDEDVQTLLVPSDAGVDCVGCHSSTPDGQYVALSATPVHNDGRPAHADIRSLDGNATQPAFLSSTAATLLGRGYQQQPVFSAAHWSAGDRVALTTFEIADATEIIWTDLEASSSAQDVGWGVIARAGDSGSAAAPAFRHDGSEVAYTASDIVVSGMNLHVGDGDIYTVPYGNRAGGVAEPVMGASEPDVSEHYPAYSADDRLLAFTRVPVPMSSYHNPQSEVYVVPSGGGAPVRLAANDPPSCSGETSPGVGNSWPKWSPHAETANGVQYYWLTFSSQRDPTGLPQLYVAAITVDESVITTYPALYFWNQPAAEHNHTPAWDDFDIVVD